MLDKTVFCCKTSIPVAVIALAGLVSCSSGNSERLRQAPNYASPVDTDAWSVQCYGAERREIIVMDNRTSTFYNEDGSEKSREEFCEENSTISRIE